MTFGERVKARREELNMTQEELALRIGYKSRASINKIEMDKRNMKQSQIATLAEALHTTPGYLMGWKDKMPNNVSIPAAHGVPILGTICAGDGIIADQSFQGLFFVDSSIKADYCLHVHGDSMTEAHIYDGDIAFLDKSYDFEDGKIYGVVYGSDNAATLKKVFRADGKLILQPCSPKYKAIVENPEDVFIVGEMVGVYHSTK